MDLLRRVMTVQAVVWAACGIAIAVAPRFVLVTLFVPRGVVGFWPSPATATAKAR